MEEGLSQPDKTPALWKPMQAYVLAAVCLIIGLPVGYLLRGSSPQPTAAPTEAAMPQPPMASVGMNGAAPSSPNGMPHGMPTMEDMKRMAEKKAQPLLERLKADPNNAALLNQVGIVYRSAHQFTEAEKYFEQSLAADPKNADVRSDMAACMYYEGDVDGSLAQLETALTYNPKHPGALMNIGLIRWQSKHDVPGAVASWEKLLKLNPDFPQKAKVEQMIADAQGPVIKDKKAASDTKPVTPKKPNS
jgi:cytochrome c-type biogenesis protein CcmH/NrfG